MATPENELKYELSETAYHYLLASLSPEGEAQVFRNAYYAVETDVGRRDWVLRLRQREASVGGELTLKVGRQVSPGSFSSVEHTALVQSDLPADWEETEPLRVFRQEISSEALVCRGAAKNERRLLTAPLGPAPLWELDCTTLPNGKVFYELEIEFPPETAPTAEQIAGFRAELEEWMFDQGVQAVPGKKTKYRRFLDSIGARY